jgi:hypothetical protein
MKACGKSDHIEEPSADTSVTVVAVVEAVIILCFISVFLYRHFECHLKRQSQR